MAEGIVNHFHADRFRAFSAGSHPRGVNPLAVRVMAEIGIDISNHRSKNLGEFAGQRFDCVVTLCDQARAACPIVPGGPAPIHAGFEDPSRFTGTEEELLAGFRRVRDAVRSWVETELPARCP
jgi:arsenate reductase